MIGIEVAATLDDALTALASLAQQNESKGEKTLVFCEDRLTLLAEQAVLGRLGGSFLTEVTTFRRFLKRGGSAGKTLSKQGSVLVTAALLKEHEEKLGCFRHRAAEAVYETMAQLSASCITEEDLTRCAEEAEGVLARKLSDLALLFRAYHAFLKDRGLLDESSYLALLPSAIRQGGLEKVHVVFFAFPSFTRQALEGVRAALYAARSVTGIFLGGGEEFYTGEAVHAFERLGREFGSVRTVRLSCNAPLPARAVLGALFSTEAPKERIATTHVRTFTPKDEDEEMETIAAQIKKLTAEGKKYSDIAVLVGGEDYFLHAEKAFRAFRIPFYADVKKKFSEHPFCVFLSAVLEAAADGFLPDEADDVAASIYFGSSDEYRNYLRRYGAFRGGAMREVRSREEIGASYGDYETLCACAARMKKIGELFRRGRREEKGSYFLRAIRELRLLVDEKTVTAGLAAVLPEEERAFLDLDRLEDVLTETEAVAGEMTFTARQFSKLLKSGFEALTLSVLPQRADAVFVGDITMSRIRRADVLFAAGLTDEVPVVAHDTAVITDGEIGELARLKVELDPAIAVVNARARQSLALSLGSFKELLVLSAPARRKGEAAVRSEIFYDLERTFSMAPMPEAFPYDCSEYAPALLSFFRDLDRSMGERSPENAAKLQARYSTLRELLLAPTRADWRSGDPLELARRAPKTATREAGELMLSGISPTRLEEYFACPYRGFALKALRLSEGEDGSTAADAGTFIHTVLERTAVKFNELENEAACAALARETAVALFSEKRFSFLAEDTDAGRYAAERLREEAVAVTLASFRQLKGSLYRVRAVEAALTLPALGMRGKTDRIDESDGCVRVIDYKTGAFEDGATEYYTGRRLQLELYLVAASEGGMPAGAFYFPAANDFSKRDEEKFRMRGFYCKDPEVIEKFDRDFSATGKSAFFESGPRSEKGMTGEDFRAFLSYSHLVALGAEREMREGNLAPSPYEGACKYCKLKALCGFVGEPRKEPTIKCSEIAAIAKEADHE